MTFSHPENLAFGAILLIVPLLYLVRRRSRLAPVPHLFLWERALASQGHSRRSRIHDILGFLLNVLILSSFVLMAAGPRAEVKKRAKRPSLLVIDSSLSMEAARPGESKRIERAVELASRLAKELAEEGPVALLFANKTSDYRQPLGAELAAIEDSLKEAVDCRGVLDINQLLSFVSGLRERQPDLRVILVSDLAFEAAPNQLQEADVEVVAVKAAEVNLAVVDFQLSERRGADFRVNVTVEATGGPMAGELLMTAPDGSLSRASLDLAPSERRVVELVGRHAAAGFVALEVRASEDSIAADNRLEFYLDRDPRLRLLVVADELSEHLESALSALDEIFDPLQASKVKPQDWRRVDLANYDLVLMRGVEEKRELPPGKYILMASSAPKLPFEVQGESLQPTVLRQTQGAQLLRGLDLRDLSINRAQELRARPGLEVLLESDQGVLLSRGQTETVSFVQLAIDATEEASSLVLLPAFPLLLQDASLELCPSPKRFLPRVLPADALIALDSSWPGDFRLHEVATATGERGPELVNELGEFRSPDRLGRARFELGSVEEEAGLAVLDARASSVQSLPQEAAAPAGPAARIPGDRSLNSIFLAVALALLMLEWLLFSRGWSQ